MARPGILAHRDRGVLTCARNPFNDRIIASGSDDGKVFLWEVPSDFTLYTDAEEISDVSPVSKLTGHSRHVWLADRRKRRS